MGGPQASLVSAEDRSLLPRSSTCAVDGWLLPPKASTLATGTSALRCVEVS